MKGAVSTSTLLRLLGGIIFVAVALIFINAILSGLNPNAFFNQNLVNAFFKDFGS